MAGILLVHGAWHGPWCWDGFAQRLAGAGHDVRTVRLRGHDGSPGRLWYRVRDYVRDVSEAVNRFPEPPVVVGHSLGGLVVAKYLERGRARGAVLLAPIPQAGSLTAVIRLASRHPLIMARANLTLRLRPFVTRRALVRELFFTPDTASLWSTTSGDGSRTSPIWPSWTPLWCGPARHDPRARAGHGGRA